MGNNAKLRAIMGKYFSFPGCAWAGQCYDGVATQHIVRVCVCMCVCMCVYVCVCVVCGGVGV